MATVRLVTPAERTPLGRLLDERSAADSMAAYYALHHPPDRVSVYAYYASNGVPSAFLAVARTGLDLFRPLAIPFVAQPTGMDALLRAALLPGRPVLLHAPLEQRAWVEATAELSNVRVFELFRLDLRAFEPIVNVLVVEARAPGGWPRYEIRSSEVVHVAAGLNWKGPVFAEVYLEVDPEVRGRAFGRSALAAIAGRLLSESIVALYRIPDDDPMGRAEARRLGFRTTGVRTFEAQALLGGGSPLEGPP